MPWAIQRSKLRLWKQLFCHKKYFILKAVNFHVYKYYAASSLPWFVTNPTRVSSLALEQKSISKLNVSHKEKRTSLFVRRTNEHLTRLCESKIVRLSKYGWIRHQIPPHCTHPQENNSD